MPKIKSVRAYAGWLALVCLLGCPLPRIAHAQFASDARVGFGDRLRIHREGRLRDYAVFVHQSDSGLTVKRECGWDCNHNFTIPWTELDRVELEIWRPPTRRRVLAATGTALVAGYVANVLVRRGTRESCAFRPCEGGYRKHTVAASTLVAALVGGGLVWRSGGGVTWETLWPHTEVTGPPAE